MKYILFGVLLALIGSLVSIIVWDIHMVSVITSGIGFFFIGVALITSGSMVSGDRMRANFATESNESREERQNISFYSILIGLPNIAVAILFYFLLK